MSGVRSLHAKTGCNATLKEILNREGIHVELLTKAIPPEAREAWYEQLKAGMQVCISHPRLVATGMDYLEYERAQSVVLFFLKPVMLQAGINYPRIERQWARNVFACAIHGFQHPYITPIPRAASL